MRAAARPAAAASASASAVRSSPSRTTALPPTNRCASVGAPNTSVQTGSAMPLPGQPVDPPDRDVRELAHLQRPQLGVTAEAARAACRGRPQALPRGQRERAAAEPGREQGLVQLVDHPAGLVGRRAVHPEPHRHARVEQVPHPRDARPEPGVGRGAVRHAGAGGGEPGDRGVGEVHAVGEPHVVAEPAQVLRVLDGRGAERRAAELLLVERSRPGACACARPLAGPAPPSRASARRSPRTASRAPPRSAPSPRAPGRASG